MNDMAPVFNRLHLLLLVGLPNMSLGPSKVLRATFMININISLACFKIKSTVKQKATKPYNEDHSAPNCRFLISEFPMIIPRYPYLSHR